MTTFSPLCLAKSSWTRRVCREEPASTPSFDAIVAGAALAGRNCGARHQVRRRRRRPRPGVGGGHARCDRRDEGAGRLRRRDRVLLEPVGRELLAGAARADGAAGDGHGGRGGARGARGLERRRGQRARHAVRVPEGVREGAGDGRDGPGAADARRRVGRAVPPGRGRASRRCRAPRTTTSPASSCRGC